MFSPFPKTCSLQCFDVLQPSTQGCQTSKKARNIASRRNRSGRDRWPLWRVTAQQYILVSWSWCYFSVTTGQTCWTEEENCWLLAHRALNSLLSKNPLPTCWSQSCVKPATGITQVAHYWEKALLQLPIWSPYQEIVGENGMQPCLQGLL